jgi:nucleoside permease NupC
LAGLLALTFLRSLLALLRLAFCLSFAGLLGSTLLDGLALLLGLCLFRGLWFARLLGSAFDPLAFLFGLGSCLVSRADGRTPKCRTWSST